MSKSPLKIAQRYAKAFFDVGEENQNSSLLHRDMLLLQETCDNNRLFMKFLQNPVIHPKTKQGILHELFTDKVHFLTLTFLDLLLSQGREAYLKVIANSFCEYYNRKVGILPVEIRSVVPLSTAEKETLSRKLSTLTHCKIQFHEIPDPSLIGGFCLRFDGMQYDASIKAQIEKLAAELS